MHDSIVGNCEWIVDASPRMGTSIIWLAELMATELECKRKIDEEKAAREREERFRSVEVVIGEKEYFTHN